LKEENEEIKRELDNQIKLNQEKQLIEQENNQLKDDNQTLILKIEQLQEQHELEKKILINKLKAFY
jgi:hypothetical protein